LLGISGRIDGVPPRSYIHATPDQWLHLAEFVRARREVLGLTQAEAAAASGGRISLAVWSILEGARQLHGRMESRSLEGVDHALGLTAGDAQKVLVGAADAPAPDAPEATPGGDVGLAALAGELSPEDRAKVEDFIRGLLDGKNR
jgi:hypothetical protein